MLIEAIYAMLKSGKEFMDIEKDEDIKAVKTDDSKAHVNSMNTACYQKLLQMKDRNIKKHNDLYKNTENNS